MQERVTGETDALWVDRIGVRYGSLVALTDVSFAVAAGELIAVVGPNGAGKSSLFRAITGIVAHSGNVAFGDEICHDRRGRSHAAFIPQRSDVNLDFPILVEEVVMLGRRRFLRLGQRPRAADRAAVARALEQVGLADRRASPSASCQAARSSGCSSPAPSRRRPRSSSSTSR